MYKMDRTKNMVLCWINIKLIAIIQCAWERAYRPAFAYEAWTQTAERIKHYEVLLLLVSRESKDLPTASEMNNSTVDKPFLNNSPKTSLFHDDHRLKMHKETH